MDYGFMLDVPDFSLPSLFAALIRRMSLSIEMCDWIIAGLIACWRLPKARGLL